MQTVCILGRQPELGLAELESLYGSKVVQSLGQQAALLDIEPAKVDMNRLGGSTKICKLLTYIPTTDWNKMIDYICRALPEHLKYIPEGKIRIGLSAYGIRVSPSKMNASGLSIKKVVKSKNRSVRIVPNKQSELNAAQIIHNQLTSPTGLELVLIASGKRTVLAQTVAVQDIDAYAARDQARPKRDARVGMLPPKLAQIIINLAAGQAHQQNLTVLDPFCGTGVLLQEALLMGHHAVGTDLDPRMVDYSQQNLEWLKQKFAPAGSFAVSEGDATKAQWPMPEISTIACETYLGRPFSAEPSPEVLREVIQDVDTIHRKFLQNVAAQTKPGFKLCIAIPAWKMRSTGDARSIRSDAAQGAAEQRTEPYMEYGEGAAQAATQRGADSRGRVLGSAQKHPSVADGFWHLPVLDSLEKLGYTRLSFVHTGNRPLLYHRANQVVARELVTLIRQ